MIDARDQPPVGFTRDIVDVGGLEIDYVIGGDGPTVVLVHGYPQTWYEWRHIMPVLAERYTVIAPSLRGAGRSGAPPHGYDKTTMASDVRRLLVHLGKDADIRLVGHDIGTMVAYAYAVAFGDDVVKLVLSEAPIVDPDVYAFPALTAAGPGPWHFGFFLLDNGFAESMISGNELLWVTKFIDHLEVVKGSVTAADVAVYAGYLADPAHLAASLAWFRTWPQDMVDNERHRRSRLTMPVLAIGADGSLGEFVAQKVSEYADNVEGAVIANSGHWIYEEHPDELARMLRTFLD